MIAMNVRGAGATLWLCILSSCATSPQITPIRSGESVAIVVAMSPQADGVIKIRNQALGKDMSTGAGSGMVVGGLWGLVCGPFAPLCVPIGAAAGAATGTAAGAVVGVTGALSEEKATLLRDRLGRLRQSHDLLDELRSNVVDRAHKHWTVISDPSGSLLTVELYDMQLTSTRDERISFSLRVLVTVQTNGAQHQSAPTQKLYEYVGPFSNLAVWMDERSDFLDTSLSSASQQIAAQIVSELALN
ncbi:hypothetical protein [Piscinibacter sp.]|jgi:hypothetical protein|uniref:hypothetical protein n=1 Tax=Piscinibacter sp. TaxID=1903157 RepID=UPI00355A3286